MSVARAENPKNITKPTFGSRSTLRSNEAEQGESQQFERNAGGSQSVFVILNSFTPGMIKCFGHCDLTVMFLRSYSLRAP